MQTHFVWNRCRKVRFNRVVSDHLCLHVADDKRAETLPKYSPFPPPSSSISGSDGMFEPREQPQLRAAVKGATDQELPVSFSTWGHPVGTLNTASWSHCPLKGWNLETLT